jgi:hypothetical protein
MTSPLNNEQKREQITTVARFNPTDADMQAGLSCCQSQPPLMHCHAGWRSSLQRMKVWFSCVHCVNCVDMCSCGFMGLIFAHISEHARLEIPVQLLCRTAFPGRRKQRKCSRRPGKAVLPANLFNQQPPYASGWE